MMPHELEWLYRQGKFEKTEYLFDVWFARQNLPFYIKHNIE